MPPRCRARARRARWRGRASAGGGPVDASAALGLDREPHDVRADRRVGRGLPGEPVRAARAERRLADQRTLLGRSPSRTASRRTRAAARARRGRARRPALDPGRDRHEQRPVAREPLRGAAHGDPLARARASRANPTPGNSPSAPTAPAATRRRAPPCESRSHRLNGTRGVGGVRQAPSVLYRARRPLAGGSARMTRRPSSDSEVPTCARSVPSPSATGTSSESWAFQIGLAQPRKTWGAGRLPTRR